MKTHAQSTNAVIIERPLPTTLKINIWPVRFGIYFVISTGLPLLLLLSYMDFASAHGIILEKGCEGSGIPFSLLSGILFALQLRFIEIPDYTI